MKVWEFQKGYEVHNENEHETNDDYTAFLNFLQAKKRIIEEEYADIAEQFNWRQRAAKFDEQKAIQVIDNSQLLNKRHHKQELLRFLSTQQAHAAKTQEIAERINVVVSNRLERAELRGEEIPLELIPAFMRSGAVVSEEARKSWAASLGVSKMVEYIDTSIKDEDVVYTEVQDLTAGNSDKPEELDYTTMDIPCDEE